jgi:hypothetical protein
MTSEEKVMYFLASEPHSNEIIDLMMLTKGMNPRMNAASLMAHCEAQSKIAQSRYLADPMKDFNLLNRYMSWQRIIEYIKSKQ